MDQINFNDLSNSSRLQSLTRDELIEKYAVVEAELARVIRENYQLRKLRITDEQLKMVLAEQLSDLRAAMFGASSERFKKSDLVNDKTPKTPQLRIKKPSERYPNIPVREVVISQEPIPGCLSCGKVMTNSGMTEDSEQLNVIPKKFEIILQKRVKYRCSCQGCIQTAPSPKRIVEGSSFSDEMIQDVALSKYCDLIPVERYAAMASRSGLKDLPPNSLIDLTHKFSDFVTPVYDLIKADILNSRILHADETPHKMLEGSEKKSWYLWGFSNPKSCYLECHDTRSGDVASEILLNAAKFS